MRKNLIVTLFFLTLILAVYSLAVSGTENRKTKDDLYRQVELFADTLGAIQSEYVEDTKPKDLIYGALRGMASSLDPHSQFMDPETYQELKVDTEGKFGGLGIEISIKDGLLTVVTPIDDTPAWKAGVKPGDRIVKINDELTRDMTLTDAVKRLRGKPGEAVTITILRESEKKIMDVKIVRDIIKIRDIKDVRILENGIGYVRLTEFRENTARDLNLALQGLKKEGMIGLVLDLRNNPGGLLQVAVEVTGRFIEKGKLIVYTKGRVESQNMKFISSASDPLVDIPIAVLINEGSASGSEIVAGCLQDYKRAIIIGTKSFGKGSVQTVIPLSDGSALRLTTSKYYTPRDRMIHEKGILPDIVVENGHLDSVKADEKTLEKAEFVFQELEAKDKKQADKKAEGFDYKADRQLMGALDALKAVMFYKGVNGS